MAEDDGPLTPPLVSALIKAFEEIRDIGQKDAFHPVAVHDIFARHGMAKNVQQDANEAFVVLMTQIAQDLAGNSVKEVSNFHGDFWYTNTCFIYVELRTSIGTAERFFWVYSWKYRKKLERNLSL